MTISYDLLSSIAKEAGADLIGVAPIDRCADIPRKHHPSSIFPETKSIVVIGRRITRGALRGIEEGTNFANYRAYGKDWLENRFLCLTTFKIAEYLEDNGWEAVPLQNLPPEIPPMGVRVKKDLPEPNVFVDCDDLAIRAGIGEMGYCRVLLTQKFGPRQRIQVILTDALIEPSPLPTKTICQYTQGCRGFCPLGAISGEKEIEIGGKKTILGSIDYKVCASCKNGAMPNSSHPSGKPDRIAAACIRGCLSFLEEKELLENRFEKKFQIREPWSIKSESDLFKL